jgi:hypothetical protein
MVAVGELRARDGTIEEIPMEHEEAGALVW